MNRSLVLSAVFTLTSGAVASASNFSVSGAGGTIPDGPSLNAPWNTQSTWGSFTSTVIVPTTVASITKVKLSGFSHTFRGDLQMFLSDPTGVRYNIVVRPGFQGACCGNPYNYTSGTFDIVPTGGGNLDQQFDITSGAYDQFLNTGAGQWTSGTYPINNTAMGSIAGPSGAWTLNIVDWASIDTGGLTGWTLEGTDNASSATPFCIPNAGGVIACACGNANGAGVGCANTGSSGAALAMPGSASLASDATDPGTLVMNGTNLLSGSTCIFLQGDAPVAAGATFGAGIRCVGGQLFRLYVKQGIVAGAKSAPLAGDRSISNRCSDLGTAIAAGNTRYYQVYYRDPGQANPGGSCPANDTFNISMGQIVVWAP